MNNIVTFGKYKGITLTELIKIDISYVRWIVNNRVRYIPIEQMCLLENILNTFETSMNTFLEGVYYRTNLYFELEEDIIKYIKDKYPILNSLTKDIILDLYTNPEEILAIYDQTHKSNRIVKTIDNVEYIFDLPLLNDFENKYLELYRLYKLQQNLDSLETRPSQKKISYWHKIDLPYNQGNGKWLVFLNNCITDNNGLTELDRCWNIVVENKEYLFKFQNETFSAKVSTKRPNKNSNNIDNGIIILYCNDKYRKEMIDKFRVIYKYDSPIRWKYNGTGKYANRGDRVTDDISLP